VVHGVTEDPTGWPVVVETAKVPGPSKHVIGDSVTVREFGSDLGSVLSYNTFK
jgi:hypothetical protein